MYNVETPKLDIDMSRSKRKGANIAAALEAVGTPNLGIMKTGKHSLLKRCKGKKHLYGKMPEIDLDD